MIARRVWRVWRFNKADTDAENGHLLISWSEIQSLRCQLDSEAVKRVIFFD